MSSPIQIEGRHACLTYLLFKDPAVFENRKDFHNIQAYHDLLKGEVFVKTNIFCNTVSSRIPGLKIGWLPEKAHSALEIQGWRFGW